MSDPIGKHRPATSIKPGWHVKTDTGWLEVAVYMHTDSISFRKRHRRAIVRGQRLVRLILADGSTASFPRDAIVETRTTVEARRVAKGAAS